MSSVEVDFPQDLQDFIEEKVRQGQFSNVSEYVIALVDAVRNKRTELEAALVESLESGPAEEWASQEWQAIRQRVIARNQRD